MQGASVKQTRSVCSERARTPAGGRSRCGFAKQIRGFSAQTFDSKRMRCYRISACHTPHQRNPKPAENRTLCRARALSKRGAFVASGRGRRRAAEAGAYLRSKYADSPRNASARYRCDADRASCPGLNPSTDPHPRRIELYAGRGRKEKRLSDSDRDTLSQWQLKRKLHPGIDVRNGIHFPEDASSG